MTVTVAAAKGTLRTCPGARRAAVLGRWMPLAPAAPANLRWGDWPLAKIHFFCHPLFAALNTEPLFSIFFLFCQRLQLTCREYTFVRLGLYNLASFLNLLVHDALWFTSWWHGLFLWFYLRGRIYYTMIADRLLLGIIYGCYISQYEWGLEAASKKFLTLIILPSLFEFLISS